MKFIDALILALVLGFSAWLGAFTPVGEVIKTKLMPPLEEELISNVNGEIYDFFLTDAYLDRLVDRWYGSLSPTAKAGQLIMPAWDQTLDETALEKLIKAEVVGGFMLLNDDFTPKKIADLKSANPNEVPLLVSIDAEPSLLKYRFAKPVYEKETLDLDTSDKISETTKTMSTVLKNYGVNLNFAPVYDLGLNKTVIGARAFGDTSEVVIKRANQMSQAFMAEGIIPTAKHFPGHGLVAGDTHLEAQTITVPLTELPQFEAAIGMGVPVMMVGHLTVSNQNYDTLGLPASLSSLMMQDLLRQRLGFKGVIITDAMNMQALEGFEDPALNALLAGADIILMPQEALTLNKQIVEIFNSSPDMAAALEQKVKRVLRLKLVWKLNKYQ